MTLDFAFVTKVFAALFAITNPIANVPVFLSLTEGASDAMQQRVAVTASIGSAIGCVVTVVAGNAILQIFGISIDDFRMAGGLLVLLIALTMVQGAPSHAHSSTPREKDEVENLDFESVAIYPLTVPLIVGPGTIATLIVYSGTARLQHKYVELGIGVGAFLVLLTASLLAAPHIGRHLSHQATAIGGRIMGMILAAIAMEMIVASLRALFPGLTGR